MFLRKAMQVLVKKGLLGLSVLILVAGGGTALAMTINGDGTIVGTPYDDTITTGNGNDIVWGLGGSDTIYAGNGNDMVDGDGKCDQGNQGQDFAGGIPGTNQCAHGNDDSTSQKDTIYAGNGNDSIFGGGGHNTITAGTGTDYIYGGPLGDTISTAANGKPTIYLCSSSSQTNQVCSTSYSGSTVNIGTGATGYVYAANGYRDTINCNGAPVVVYADQRDVLNNCKAVKHTVKRTRRVKTRRA